MYIKNKIEKAAEYRLRHANDLGSKIDFASNDYLGAAKAFVPSFHINDKSNVRSSRMLFGQHNALSLLEENMAVFFGFQSAIVFQSGYQANVGLLSAFSGRNVHFYYDELIHASMHDGLRLGVNKRFVFQHNNYQELDSLLQKNASSADINIILCEGLYSMDGDCSNANKITLVAEKHAAKIIVDEAHSSGIFGENGLGLWKAHSSILAKVVTFGKAYGSEGAVVLCNAECKQFLYQYCRALIYSTAPSAAFCNGMSLAFNWVVSANNAREQLQSNIDFFRENLADKLKHKNNFPSVKESPVQVLLMPKETLLEIEKKASENNMALKAIFAPSVAKGQERIRISLHAYNSSEEILQLCHLLNSFA